MSRKIFILLAGLLLASCQSTEEPAAPQPYSPGIRIRLQYEGYAMAESRSATRLDTDYDRVEFGVADLAGNIIENLKGVYNAETSEMRIEGLQAGDYMLLILGIRGDCTADGVVFHRMRHLDDTWMSFPEELEQPLAAEYLYSQTPFTVTTRTTAAGNVQEAVMDQTPVQRRIVGRADFIFDYNNPYVAGAVVSKQVMVNAPRFRTKFSGAGDFAGESAGLPVSLSLDYEKSFLFPPTVDNEPLRGDIEIVTRNYRGYQISRSFDFELAKISPNHIGTIRTDVLHPDDASGTMFVSEQYYRTSEHSLILQDDEHHSVYADPTQRRFNTAAPLQLSVTDDGRFHARFYSPRPLSDVLVRARIPGTGDEFVDLAYFDNIPAFADFYGELLLTQRDGIYRTESGRMLRIPAKTTSDLAGIEYRIESSDPYWKKLEQIAHGWTISFNLYDGDPERPDGGPVGNWMGIRPVHCREVVALFINFTYMIDMPEHEEILRANEDRLYGNGGVDDKVTAETVLKQMQQARTLSVGLVYPGNNVIGLGGGSVFGAYQPAWLRHYFDTYACEIMFHELGHVMGYSHSSSFTYGPWAQELMNTFYVEHIGEMPIDSPSYLNSSQNPNLY